MHSRKYAFMESAGKRLSQCVGRNARFPLLLSQNPRQAKRSCKSLPTLRIQAAISSTVKACIPARRLCALICGISFSCVHLPFFLPSSADFLFQPNFLGGMGCRHSHTRFTIGSPGIPFERISDLIFSIFAESIGLYFSQAAYWRWRKVLHFFEKSSISSFEMLPGAAK